MLIRGLFREQVEKTTDSVAVVFNGKEATWREIDSLSNRLAQGILNLGIGKGDRVAGVLTNSLEFIVTYLALFKSGVVFVPLNYQSRGPHLQYTLNHSESRVLICDDQFIPTVKGISPELKFTRHIISVGGDGSPGEVLSFESVLSQGEDVEPVVPLDEDDIALFLYTAGTTGDPKGVVHTHSNCTFVAQHWAGVFHMEPGKSVLMPLPLFHVFGIHCITVPALISGARLIVTDRYRTLWAMEAIEKYRVTALALVPTMATMILNHEDFSKYDLSSPEITLIGGAIVPFELLKQWRKAFPKVELINAYGQTESCPCCTGLWDVDILEKPGSVGKPWNSVSLKILDDGGGKLPPGRVGEIVYKVPSIMKEYYKDPEQTAETVRNGWLHSGDLGYLDENGYLYIVDRKKDIIIRGGENISSMEIEEVLHKHPGVLEASAIGAPHPILGETVMAVVVKRPGYDLSEEALMRFCEEHFEHYKVPTRVEFVGEFPRNPGGKVLKRELKDKYFGERDVR
jgi:acyl-CoA synthetase (AMP-forming)/AMP-acid ligase II